MKDWVSRWSTMLRLQHHKRGSRAIGIPSSPRRDFIHSILVVALARLLCLASVLDRETACYFFEDQATALSPKKMQYPVMILRSSELLPQSASEKPIKDRCEEHLRVIP